MSSIKDITDNIRFLRNASPQAYDKFIAAFNAYTDQVTANLVQATPDNLQLMQGQAQQCVNLLRAFEEANKNG